MNISLNCFFNKVFNVHFVHFCAELLASELPSFWLSYNLKSFYRNTRKLVQFFERKNFFWVCRNFVKILNLWLYEIIFKLFFS